jgi:hypothetical protein
MRVVDVPLLTEFTTAHAEHVGRGDRRHPFNPLRVSGADLRRRRREATSWVAPMELWSFLSLHTIFLQR